MKNIAKVILALLILVSAIQINAFEASSTAIQAPAVPGTVQNITFDGDQQYFTAPMDGPYTISFSANAHNQRNIPGLVTIKAYVNNVPSIPVTATTQIPAAQQVPIHFNGTIELKQNDVVRFRWGVTGSTIVLQPANNEPSFEVTIEPQKPSIKL